jgi:hypothetical protein
MYLLYGPWSGLLCGLGAGLFFGLIMTATLGTVHNLSTKTMKTDDVENMLGVHQTQVITINQPASQAYETCLQCIRAMKNCKETRQDQSLGIIYAQTGWSWQSFGEKLTFIVSEESPETSKVTVSSKPILPTTLIDYGKNTQNIREAVSTLRHIGPVIEAHVEKESSDAASSQALEIESAGDNKSDSESISLKSEQDKKA